MDTDYLIVGAGAQGLIFADEMLTHSDARLTLVDRRDRVGGHWNDAYSFVRLHQPSVYYGLGSQSLGRDAVETGGINAGLFEQASGAEILHHFEGAMRRRFADSGRVRFLPMHEYTGDWTGEHNVTSLVTGQTQPVEVSRAIVDTTWFDVQTPERHIPSFQVEPGAPLTTPARLPSELPGSRQVVVIGGGKTSMDVVIWLVERGFPVDRICWIRPRDSWLINRETAQPGDAGFLRMVASQSNRLEASAEADSIEDLYLRLEQSEELFRIDRSVFPTMNHGATISRGECAILAQVNDVVRGRRVGAVRPGELAFDTGEPRRFSDGALFVDCTARAFNYRDLKPVFAGNRITLQVIRDGLVSLSAAAIGYIEASHDDEARKNALCLPIPYSEDPATLAARYRTELLAQAAWAGDKGLRRWAKTHRLTGYGGPADDAAEAEVSRLGETIASLRPKAFENLSRLIGEPTRV